MNLDTAKAHIGHRVGYYQHGMRVEQGVITGINHRYVFVRYDRDRYPKATAPENLELLEEPPTEQETG